MVQKMFSASKYYERSEEKDSFRVIVFRNNPNRAIQQHGDFHRDLH